MKNEYTNLNIYTSAVYYRDEGDDYLIKHSDFTSTTSKTIAFINDQKAKGGGDYPEAVHSAMDYAINKLNWSSDAKTRIAFLILDAPPHEDDLVIEKINLIAQAAAMKGIKIIPITASGIGQDTEALMRFLAIITNGTYVFITNDSGIGGDHLEASVGDFQVEYLKDPMSRLIKKYAQ